MNGNNGKQPAAQPLAYDAALNGFSPEELSIRMLTELHADKSVLARRIFFDGGEVLVCAEGRFRFSFGGNAGTRTVRASRTDARAPEAGALRNNPVLSAPRGQTSTVELAPGEILVVYPGNVVTIESLKPKGHLRYAILNGTRTDEFFDSFGFYDRLKFTTDAQYDTFLNAVAQFEAGNPRGALSLIYDAFRTFGTALRQGKRRATLFDAIRVIHRNLAQGIVRLQPIYDELDLSRATLHRIFTENGLPGPGEFLRQEQMRRARHLLTSTTLPIRDVAKRIGIPSPVYFTEFVRKFAGTTPTKLRQEGLLG